MSIVLEESDETVFWLEMLIDAEVFPKERVASLLMEANELTSIFVSSLRTCKGLQ
jgi:four helix bundle protein